MDSERAHDVAAAPLVERLSLRFCPDALQTALQTVLSRHPFNHNNQVCLTHRAGDLTAIERAYEGTGHLWDPKIGDFRHSEFDYSQFNLDFADTYFSEVFSGLSEAFAVGRSRLMLCRSRTCYSLHHDMSRYRYHIALRTNPGCWLVYPNRGNYHIPADGHLYRVVATELHSAMNAGATDRVHLVLEARVKVLAPS